ncbi:MAG: flavodoxin-dependent (E)-4-hydroxy-3-methylbut-2-enyl-diphosphate synthase, partial [Acidimicrobiia bacterium]
VGLSTTMNRFMSSRRKTRQVSIGRVEVGGDAPISVQSMTITKTADVGGTLAQVYALRGAGADIVRITCNELEAAQALAEIVPRSPVPIVADVHFQYRLALAALEAGVAGLRLNPGNIRKPEHIKAVARAAGERGVPIRVGVNAGSLDKDILAKYGSPVPKALVESALHEVHLLEEAGFTDIKISVKHSDVPSMVDAYRLLSEQVDYPLHLGVTEAGPPPGGLIKSIAGIATLLLEGIGDTIRLSLTADPVEEAEAGRRLLEYLGLRERTALDLIACPSCGRAEIDVLAVAQEAQHKLEQERLPIQVAVMGCVVNGPGEAREADIGIAAGRGKGHLFIKGQVVRVVPEAEMVDALLDEARKLTEEGVEARLAAADASAAELAEQEAEELLTIRGDVNRVAERRAAVADVATGH